MLRRRRSTLRTEVDRISWMGFSGRRVAQTGAGGDIVWGFRDWASHFGDRADSGRRRPCTREELLGNTFPPCGRGLLHRTKSSTIVGGIVITNDLAQGRDVGSELGKTLLTDVFSTEKVHARTYKKQNTKKRKSLFRHF